MEQLLQTLLSSNDRQASVAHLEYLAEKLEQTCEVQAIAIKGDGERARYLSIPVPRDATPEEVVRALCETDVLEGWSILYPRFNAGAHPPIPCLTTKLAVKRYQTPLSAYLPSSDSMSDFRIDAIRVWAAATFLHACYVELQAKLQTHFQPLFSVFPVEGEPRCIGETVDFFSRNSENGDDPAACEEHRGRCINSARSVFSHVSDALKMLSILIRRFADVARWVIDNEYNPNYADFLSVGSERVWLVFHSAHDWYEGLHVAYLGYLGDWNLAMNAHDDLDRSKA